MLPDEPGRPARDARRMVGRGIAAAGIGTAATAVVALHVVGAGRVDPVARTVSDYVAIPGGAALLGLAAAGLIVAALAAAMPLDTPVRRVLLVWCAAVLLVAVFPTNVAGEPADVAAVVHRWAGAVVFGLPPVAGLLASRIADGVRRARLAAGSAVAAVTACTFLLAHAPHVLAGTGPFVWLGLVERVAYVALLGLLLLLATPGARHTAGPAPEPVRSAA